MYGCSTTLSDRHFARSDADKKSVFDVNVSVISQSSDAFHRDSEVVSARSVFFDVTVAFHDRDELLSRVRHDGDGPSVLESTHTNIHAFESQTV